MLALTRLIRQVLPAVVLAGAPVSAVAQAPAAPAPAPARTFTLQEFRSLRWLEGRWRGRLPNGGFFHEERVFADDSTMTTRNYGGDSTFTNLTEAGDLTFRGGVIASGGGRRVVTSLDSNHVAFTRGTSTVRFDRQAGGRWVATLSGVDREGRTQQVTYPMESYRP